MGWRRPVRERLEELTIPEPNSGCWLFLGYVDKLGYGRLNAPPIGTLAHRVSYTLARGPIPAGMPLDHLCRNTSCVNPAHLEAVTARENTVRRAVPFVKRAPLERCRNGHPYDEANVHVTAAGIRRCRACWRASAARHAAKMRSRG